MAIDLFRVFRNQRVLVTGHTGFKGGWLSQWLIDLGAEVSGIALPPEGEVSLFEQLSLETQLSHHICDIRDYGALKETIGTLKPGIIFHLAAQPIVRESYLTPLETVQTNVMGTVHLLEAVRTLKIPATIVVITSDKSYENQEWLYGYRESDAMGGYDPYSASKGACEVLTASWRRSFFNPAKFGSHGVKLASARAGNVIGGGDWAPDRIVPDCMRALLEGKEIVVRNPLATRPWQHVLEPLGGYLLLAARMLEAKEREKLETYCEGFNFGPLIGSNRSVETLVNEVIRNWGEGSWTYEEKNAVHEASLLNLTIDKSFHQLGWHPVWDFRETVRKTVEWYLEYSRQPGSIPRLTRSQIQDYSESITLT